MTAAIIAGADAARDALAWQIGRVVLGDARTFDQLTGREGRASVEPRGQSAAQMEHSFRLWKAAMRVRTDGT